MKRLHFLRHAKSSWDDPELEDIDRPLAERGHRAGAAMAAVLKERGLRVDQVLVSTARRTRQTFDYLCPMLEGVPVQFESRLYVFSAAHLLDRLRELPDSIGSVLVIGHNPAMQELAVALTDRQDPPTPELATLRDKFPTAGYALLVCGIDRWDDLGPGVARLDTLIRPKDLNL
ncbi:MAG: histidine phosphatase family protein [Rhodospirillaceae bacterium]